jgi:xylulokinase
MLTGVALTDPSDASGTGLYSIAAQDWSTDLAEAFGVDARLLPPIVPSGSPAGTITRDAARATGLAEGTPVAAGAADNAAAALGAGVVRPGQLMISVGTSGTLLAPNVCEPDTSGRCHLFRDATDGWYSMAVVLSAGGALSWWGQVTGGDLGQLGEEAAEIPPGSEGLTMLPYLSGERMPRNRPDARGGFVGLSLAHRRAHLTRAVLEGAAFALADGLLCLKEVGIQSEHAILTGAASSHPIWQEVLALALPGLELAQARLAEGAALGAALLGFQASGRSLEELLGEIVSVEPLAPPPRTAADKAAVAAAYIRFQAASNDPLLTAARESIDEESQ